MNDSSELETAANFGGIPQMGNEYLELQRAILVGYLRWGMSIWSYRGRFISENISEICYNFNYDQATRSIFSRDA